MSTRAQIIIRDGFGDELWFYRHSDGYPEGTLPTLEKFLDLVKSGKIRDNAEQSAGWIIIIGHDEYKEYHCEYPEITDWKVGAYEPCSPIEHRDIEFLYTVDLVKKEITYKAI
jgi:hypothetical protein